MPKSPYRGYRALGVLVLIYGVASLGHFAHNAEFLSDYPNMPHSWSRARVYFAWFGMTAVGVFGWLSLARGFTGAGLLLLALYSALGLDSLGHYALAPMSAHTMAMNSTILVEVAAAALVLLEVLRLLVRRLLHRVGRV